MQTEEDRIRRIAEQEALRIVRIYGGGGGGSSTSIKSWVNDNYLSIEFFSKLFKAYDSATPTPNEIEPNDMTSTITNIKAMFGFWTEQYLSALGQGSGGSGAAVALTDLVDVNISSPTDGQVLKYDSATGKWVNGTGGGGADMTTVWAALAANTNEQINASHLSTALSGYATTSAISDMATKTWVQNQSYLTSSSLSGYATQTWVQQQGYLTSSSLSGYATQSWVQQQGYLTSEYYTGTVTSVKMSVPTGFSISGSPITSSGTLALSFASGYSLPTTASQNNWDTAYSNSHTHSNKSVLDGITSTNVTNWNTAASTASTLSGYFDASGNAKTALKLTTVSKSIWGQTYWTSGGIPDNVSGALALAGNNLVLYGTIGSPTAYLVGYSSGTKIGVAVNGTSKFEFSTTQFYSAVGIQSDSYVTALSDARHKDIVDGVKLRVDDVAALPAVRFRWNDRKDDRIYAGTLAQSVQQVMPEVVMSQRDGTLSLDYSVMAMMSSIVIARELVALRNRVDELELKLKKS